MALGAFPDSHPQHVGMPGMHGKVSAVGALQKADLLVALGARFDDRVTGQLATFAPGAKIVHADIDPAEIGKNRRADVPIVGDCKEVLVDLLAAVEAERRNGTADLTRVVGADRRVARHLPARLRLAGRRVAVAAVRHPADREDRRTGRDLRGGRGPAPDVGGAVHRLREAAHLAQLRRPGHDGLRGARRDGREGRAPGRGGLGDRRRRLLPDDQPGARHLRDRGHPDQGRRDQQRQPGHGPAVAEPVLRRAVLPDQPRHAQVPDPGLPAAGRVDGVRRDAGRVARRGRPDDPAGDGDQRSPRRRRLRRRCGRAGLADGRGRHRQRPADGGPQHPAAVRRRRAERRRRHRGRRHGCRSTSSPRSRTR